MKMAKYLFVVESPNKIKKLKDILGNDFKILPTVGHMFELEKKGGKGVVVEDGFRLNKRLAPGKKEVADNILNAAKVAKLVYIATDPDREGGVIGSDVVDYLRRHKCDTPIARVLFNEITHSAVWDGIKNAGKINLNQVHAGETRSALDYLVGFGLSPLLWRSGLPNASAGRVQSPALRLICERQEQINQFIPVGYCEFTAIGQSSIGVVKAQFNRYKKHTAVKILPDTDIYKSYSGNMDKLESDLKQIRVITVDDVKQRNNTRKPPAPFITSSMQQTAFNQLGFSSDKTMTVAQRLFEGGYITYHRSDSISMSQEAIFGKEAEGDKPAVKGLRPFIEEQYGKDYLHESVRVYQSKSKNVQGAHECIRPAYFDVTPESIRHKLEDDQYRLYNLIWKRAVASQMSDCRSLITTVSLSDGDFGFKISGSEILFDGYTKIYRDDDSDEYKQIPSFKVGDKITITSMNRDNKQTEPPAKYNEGSLVKELETKGIGRPSTYASIIKTLKTREFVEKDGKSLKPTDKGILVNRYLTANVPEYVNYEFTSYMEEQLDNIEQGNLSYLTFLRESYDKLQSVVKPLKEASKEGGSKTTNVIETLDRNCPSCGKHLVKRLGRFGTYISCSGYPECKHVEKANVEVVEDRKCPKCDSVLYRRVSKKGTPFIGCSGYPKCDHVEWLNEEIDDKDKVTCPYCGQGHLTQRKGRFGVFYSCSRYPDCTPHFISQKEYDTLKAGGSIELKDVSYTRKPKPNKKGKGKPKKK